ncbi:hypothetical protein V494_03452 [Pseudogymnoascus sp. VKM F-4513 (FW-928)]|nr:hypothetical protein V494_03452 [Pseudogymnoascus sp. VKM F-4513 (FW-928)]
MAPNEYPASEGLQVVPAHEGLQVVPPQPGLEVASGPGSEKIEKAGVPAYQGIEVAPDGGLEPVQPTRKASGTICGLRRRTFAIIAGIILVAVIVAAVVGGVVGSKHSSNRSSSPDPAQSGSSSIDSSPTKTGSPTTTSPHSTTTTSTGPIPTSSLALDCPAINGTTRSIKSAETTKKFNFDIYCEANFAPGQDTGGINATSLNACIQGCINLIELGAPCVGVVWDSIFNTNLDHNCFLKDSKEGGVIIKDKYATHPAAAVINKT